MELENVALRWMSVHASSEPHSLSCYWRAPFKSAMHYHEGSQLSAKVSTIRVLSYGLTKSSRERLYISCYLMNYLICYLTCYLLMFAVLLTILFAISLTILFAPLHTITFAILLLKVKRDQQPRHQAKNEDL